LIPTRTAMTYSLCIALQFRVFHIHKTLGFIQTKSIVIISSGIKVFFKLSTPRGVANFCGGLGQKIRAIIPMMGLIFL